MTIRIDVPGIGQIVAENAATESTLRELVRVLGGSVGGSGNNRNDQRGSSIIDSFVSFGGKLINTTKQLSMQTLQLTEQFSNLGNSVTGAAAALTPFLNKIPIVGTVLSAAFTATAKAAENLADSFQKATSVGADFGGSVNTMARSASQAGMTIDQFAGLLASAGPSMLAFGNNTATGAKRFSELSKELRASGEDLYALGLSTQDINEGLAAYGNLLKITGRNEGKSNEDLIRGSKQYLREMDLLAKITGESRKEKEKEREQLMQDVKFQAFASTLTEDSQKELMLLIQSYPKELQGYVKDVVMSGTTTLEANQAMAHGLSGTTNQLVGIRQNLLNDERVSASMRQQVAETTKAEAKAVIQSNRDAITGNDAYAQSMAPLTHANKIQTGAALAAQEAQDRSKASTDRFNEQVRKAQERVAGISNTFKEALANSGLLPKLMDFFGLMSDIVIRYVLPAFSDYLVPALMQISDFLIELLVPVFEFLGDVLKDFAPILDDSFGFLDRVLSSLTRTFREIAPPIQRFYDQIIKGSGIIEKISNAFQIAGDLAVGALDFFGRLLSYTIDPITDITQGFIDLLAETEWVQTGLKYLGDALDTLVHGAKIMFSSEGADFVVQYVKDFFNIILKDIALDIRDWFEGLFLDLQVLIYELGGKLLGLGISPEEAKAAKEVREEENRQRENELKVAENARNNILESRKAQLVEEEKTGKKSKKIFERSAGMTSDTLKNTAKAINLNTTTASGTIDTLKQFAEQQGKSSGFKNADAAKESIGEAAKEAVKETKPSTAPTGNEPSPTGTGTGRTMQASNQSSSPAASNQLNTIMTELVELMRQNNLQNRQMMSSIASLSGNLYDA